MKETLCGFDCNTCELKSTCKGCLQTEGRPFGGECIIASCVKKKKCGCCDKCNNTPCELETELIKEFNDLKIADMDIVTNLNAICGAYINMKFNLKNGSNVQLLDDKKIYFGNQVCRKNSDKCYGLAADEEYLLVCEYGINGVNPEVVVWKRR